MPENGAKITKEFKKGGKIKEGWIKNYSALFSFYFI
jgi:hypothetical protein